MRVIFFFKRIHYFLCSLGINIKKFINIIYFPKFFIDFLKFTLMQKKINFLFPILGDHKEKSGNINFQYFYQDLLISQKIFKSNPQKHVDIGSRVDGFISSIASFRKVEMLDLRDNKVNNCYSKIIINSSPFTTLIRGPEEYISKDLVLRSPINLSKLNIQLLDFLGNTLDIGKNDFSFTLELGYVYDDNLYKELNNKGLPNGDHRTKFFY